MDASNRLPLRTVSQERRPPLFQSQPIKISLTPRILSALARISILIAPVLPQPWETIESQAPIGKPDKCRTLTLRAYPMMLQPTPRKCLRMKPRIPAIARPDEFAPDSARLPAIGRTSPNRQRSSPLAQKCGVANEPNPIFGQLSARIALQSGRRPSRLRARSLPP